MPSSTTRYRSRSVYLSPGLKAGISLVSIPYEGISVELPETVAMHLRRMQAFKTLEEHAEDLAALTKVQDKKSYLPHLELAAEAGLLVSPQGLDAMLRQQTGEIPAPQALSHIGILTCNRPEGLKRCAESFMRNAAEYGRVPELAVVDDSAESSIQEANQAILKEIKSRHPASSVFYAGPAQKRLYAEKLAAHSGIDPSIIEFALLNPEGLGRTTGANRNALFLHMAGKRFLSLDDDVACRISALNKADDAMEISSIHDPTEVRLFPDRDTLLYKAPPIDADMLGMHERVLGKTLSAIAEDYRGLIHSEHMDGTLQEQLMRKSASVRVSWTGLYGDSGAGFPNYYLWKDDSMPARLMGSEEEYTRLATSREIFRSPVRLNIGAGGYCQSTALAFDKGVLPPFMPVERGSDVVFGRTLTACFSPGLIAYLPYAILHAPVEARKNTRGQIAEVGQNVFFCDIVSTAIGLLSGIETLSEEAALASLGRNFCDLGELPAADFHHVMTTRLWTNSARRAHYLRNYMQQHPEMGEWWRQDIDKHSQTIYGKLKVKNILDYIKFDGPMMETAQVRQALCQRVLARFGLLLQAWPAMVKAAEELKQQSIRVGKEIK